MEGKITLSPNQISLEDNSTMQVTNDGISRHRYLQVNNAARRVQTCFHIQLLIQNLIFLFRSINVTVCLKFKNQQPNPLFGECHFTVVFSEIVFRPSHRLENHPGLPQLVNTVNPFVSDLSKCQER